MSEMNRVNVLLFYFAEMLKLTELEKKKNLFFLAVIISHLDLSKAFGETYVINVLCFFFLNIFQGIDLRRNFPNKKIQNVQNV